MFLIISEIYLFLFRTHVNIGPLIQWYSEKTKERCTTGSPPKGYVIGTIKKKTKKNN